jgi:hypothetical protein
MKQTRLKPVSKKKRQEKADTDEPRRLLKELLGKCACCSVEGGLETHEILAGRHRHRSVYHRELQLVFCHECHEVFQGSPLAMQLAFKVQSDPWFFDLDCVRANYGTGRGILVNMADIRTAAVELGLRVAE